MVNLNTGILLKYILEIRLCYELDTIILQFTVIPIHYIGILHTCPRTLIPKYHNKLTVLKLRIWYSHTNITKALKKQFRL